MNYDEENNFNTPRRIGELLKPPVRSRSTANRAKSERAELVGYFADKLNQSRVGTRFKALSYRAVGVQLKHLKVFDLYTLKASCLEAEKKGIPFGAAFWTRLKDKKSQ